jgi:hypothetical protein
MFRATFIDVRRLLNFITSPDFCQATFACGMVARHWTRVRWTTTYLRGIGSTVVQQNPSSMATIVVTHQRSVVQKIVSF